MKQRQIRVLIADDHPIFRHGLKQVIELDQRLAVVAEAAHGRDAITQTASACPDVVLIDVDMPVLDGFAAARLLHREYPNVKIVFLTLYKDEMHLNGALDVGAHGYLVKDSAANDVVQCITAVMQGLHYISPGLSTYVLKRGEQQAELRPLADLLTQTERTILTHLAEYKTNKQIALELKVSVRTVENHRANMCEKLGLQGAHALARFAIQKARATE